MESEENGTGEEVGLLVLEAKSLRPFKTKDEYLYAMKEDLAEWFKCLYEDIYITAENFLEVLETGVLLCQHANEVRKFVSEQRVKGDFVMKSNFVRDIQIPQYEVQFRVDVKPETFLARDNVSNFITWTVKMGIPEVLRFETDDLVLRKNERSVVLCLLEVARVGAKFGMLAPTIVQMEEEIDEEIATGEPPPQIKTCDIKSLDEMVRELVGRCTCPVQFPIIKVGEGKYKIGDSQTLVFVRILRKHVMIRVGGGWDTLEHYLDRHDPCRCGFQGHRQGGRVTGRRASTTGIAQSLPNTPRTPRRLSVTATVGSSAQPSQGSSNIRCASPGPNSKKLPLNRTHSQPGSTVTSPDSVKSPSLSSTGTFSGLARNSVSNVSVSKTKTSAQTSNSPNTVKGVSSAGPINTRRSASPAPGIRRSQSPAPEAINRLRSPSPAPSSSKSTPGTRNQSVPASVAKRCASPVKQITMSELRSSREGKIGLQTLRRQTSIESSGNDVDGDAMNSDKKSSDTSLTIDKISTMSLGEFKNLLNSALSVPNGADSQCSSDSPRSQSSVDSYRNNQIPQNKRTSTAKSVSSYKASSANKAVSNVSKTNSLPRTKSSGFDSSSGYSTSSLSSDKSKNSPSNTTSTYARTSSARSKTPSGGDSPSTPRSVNTRTNLSSKQSNYSSVGATSAVGSQSKPHSSTFKARSQTSLNSESSSVKLNNAPSIPSRSSSQSSFKSYDSINEMDSYVSDSILKAETNGYVPGRSNDSKSPTEPNYVTNGLANQGSAGYMRSNSYTPCTGAENKAKWAEPRIEIRASSEPKEVVKSELDSGLQPLNVGYVSFSHKENTDLSPSYQFDEELSKIENALKKFESNNDDELNDEKYLKTETPVSKVETSVHQTPVRRPSTPSLIPRPATPKIPRKLSLTTGDDAYSGEKQNENKGRPPTPKKTNIIARAHSSSSSVKAADATKEKSYKDIFQSKRSTTPGPGNVPTNTANDTGRRCTTPGPNMNRTSSLSSTSATTTRARLNQTLEQNKEATLSVFESSKTENEIKKEKPSSRSNDESKTVRAQSVESRSFKRQNATEEPETVIMVNRSDTGHSLTVQDHVKPQSKVSANKTSILARARTEDSRSRIQTRTSAGITRRRPQSVEPRQLLPRSRNLSESSEKNEVLSVKRGEDGNHSIYNRTQEWVQTAAEQTSKVQKTKVMKQTNPKMRRAMTPNPFDKKIEQEEPRSFEEIKAALTLPINGLSRIEVDTENLEAPPEDPEMYAAMEKLFVELRKQELKASVNETPGTNAGPSKSSKSKSKSSSSMNDEDVSLDSNKNIKQRKLSLSTTSSNITSPSVPQKKSSISSNKSQTALGRHQSRTSSISNVSATSSTPMSTHPSTPRSTPPRATPPRTVSTPRSDPARPASPSMNRSSQPARPASPSLSRPPQATRPASPRTTVTSQQSKPTVQRPASPRTISNPPRPASPRSFQSPVSASPQTPRSKQPPRPASTPPRPSTPVGRTSSSRASDDSDGILKKGKESPEAATSLISKIKEIIKVKPRRDKAEGVKQKSKIPAPKSLASAGKSRSFTNLASVKSMTLPNTKANGHLDYSPYESQLNGMDNDYEINGGLNVTMTGRNEAPKLKMAMPLTTGRATVIRKESMEKNKNPPRLLRAVSVERNLGGLNNNFQFYEDGEYV